MLTTKIDAKSLSAYMQAINKDIKSCEKFINNGYQEKHKDFVNIYKPYNLLKKQLNYITSCLQTKIKKPKRSKVRKSQAMNQAIKSKFLKQAKNQQEQ
jgi:hypothetical protein